MKTTAKHTPGPWKAERLEGDHDLTGDNWAVTGPGNCFIADVNDADDGDNEANARLISAAPDLLAVANAVVQRYGDDIENDREIEGAELVDFLVQYLYPSARAAIKKAKGGK